jgi:hypothetical protein
MLVQSTYNDIGRIDAPQSGVFPMSACTRLRSRELLSNWGWVYRVSLRNQGACVMARGQISTGGTTRRIMEAWQNLTRCQIGAHLGASIPYRASTLTTSDTEPVTRPGPQNPSRIGADIVSVNATWKDDNQEA